MGEFDKKLLVIYGSVVFVVSLTVFYIIFRGFLFLSQITGRIGSGYINTFYLIIAIMGIAYVLFIAITMFLVFKDREEDLRFQSIQKYTEWRLK